MWNSKQMTIGLSFWQWQWLLIVRQFYTCARWPLEPVVIVRHLRHNNCPFYCCQRQNNWQCNCSFICVIFFSLHPFVARVCLLILYTLVHTLVWLWLCVQNIFYLYCYWWYFFLSFLLFLFALFVDLCWQRLPQCFPMS